MANRWRSPLASSLAACTLLLLLFSSHIPSVDSRAILGVDLGSLYLKVALVQRGSPLEIVTNLHSKRKTEQMILFDNGQRFYGADANALLARKSNKTPLGMSLLLGKAAEHPTVQVLQDRRTPLPPAYNETRQGLDVAVQDDSFTPEELVAMVLQHAVDISVAYAVEQGKPLERPPQDVCLTIPSFAAPTQRRALQDAARLANLNVLGLVDETVASALHYAMDKNFDGEKEQTILFYNMGASAVQVAIVRFFTDELPQKYGKPKQVPALQVLAKTWDNTVGGQALDHALVEFLADEFNQAYTKARGETKDVRTVPRALQKLKIQANKIKHVLSANTEIPVYMDAVYDDVPLQTHVKRDMLESLAGDLWTRAVQPVPKALQIANLTASDLTVVELLGGGMRVPRIQEELAKVLGMANGVADLGKHINSDESMALGASFAGANVSTAFRVRHVGLTDITPVGIKVQLSDPADAEWTKQAVVFPANGKIGVKKTIAFTRTTNVECAMDLDDPDELYFEGDRNLERYSITGVDEFAAEMATKELGKPKVSLQFELSASGIARLVKAEAAVEETYTVEEEVEVDDDDAAGDDKKDEEKKEEDAKEEKKEEDEKKDDEKKEDDKEEKKDDDDKDKKKKEEKKKKKIKVEKEKKRIHKKELKVETSYVGKVTPYTAEQFEESKAKLAAMDKADKERIMLEEAKNKVESYIYYIKNKLLDDEEVIGKVSTKKQREECSKASASAEEWLDDEGYKADLKTMVAKFEELSAPFEKIMLRVKEMTARPEAVKALEKKLGEIEALMKKWEAEKPQITEEERTEVLEGVETVRKWISDVEGKQSKKKDHDEPAFLSTEVPEQTKDLEIKIVRLSKRPKPKPPKKKAEASNETSAENATAADGEAAADADASDKKTEGGADAADGDKKEEAGETEEETKEEDAKEEAGETKEKEEL